MGYLKGKSRLIICEQYGDMRFKYRNRKFWCRGYYVDTAGKDKQKIAAYIRHQLEEDQPGEQLTMPGKSNDPPFAGHWSRHTCACGHQGPCPHMKSQGFGRWMFTCTLCIWKADEASCLPSWAMRMFGQAVWAMRPCGVLCNQPGDMARSFPSA